MNLIYEVLGRALFQCVIQMYLEGERNSPFEINFEGSPMSGRIVDTLMPASRDGLEGTLYVIEINTCGQNIRLELVASIEGPNGPFRYKFEDFETDDMDYDVKLEMIDDN
ncbi:MAG: hypothetical protein ABH826_01660 [Patescibacteria group bacterium]|nr:hypothetical protein [Patescibacteria group bacterium]